MYIFTHTFQKMVSMIILDFDNHAFLETFFAKSDGKHPSVVMFCIPLHMACDTNFKNT